MPLRGEVDTFCRRLQRRQLEGSLNVAKATAEIMRLLVTSQRHADAQAGCCWLTGSAATRLHSKRT